MQGWMGGHIACEKDKYKNIEIIINSNLLTYPVSQYAFIQRLDSGHRYPRLNVYN